MRRLAAIAVVLSSLSTRQADARDPVEIVTPYYTIVSVLNENDTRKLVDDMRTFQAVLTSFTSVKDLRPQVPLRIHLVDTESWKRYLQPNENVAGYMSPRPLGFDAVMDAYSWSNASIILFHEYTHFVLRNAQHGKYPVWFDEGLAELFSTVKTVGNKVRVGEPPAETLMSLRTFPRAHWTPLGEILRAQKNPINEEEQDGHQISAFYAQCWALVHYMIYVHPNGAQSLTDYLMLRLQGKDVDEAFKSAFGTSVDDIDAKLRTYVRQRAFAISTIDPKKLSLPAMDLYQVRRLNEIDSALDFGRLLVRRGGQQARSIEYFDKLLKSQPRNAQTVACKANVLEQLQQHDGADAAIEQAIGWAPRDQAVLISAGNVHSLRSARQSRSAPIASQEMGVEEAKKAFGYYDQAMALPGSVTDQPEIVARYANIAMQVNADLGLPLERIVQTREIYPTCPELALVHARLLVKMKRLTDAEAPLEIAMQYGSPALRATAQRLLGPNQ